MTDTRKRILDRMKLEITDNIFDDAACSCDTILAKLNYIIANGVGGSSSYISGHAGCIAIDSGGNPIMLHCKILFHILVINLLILK